MRPSFKIWCQAASAVFCVLASAGANADGRAQAGASLGIYSTWDLASDSSITGIGARDGAMVQTTERRQRQPDWQHPSIRRDLSRAC
jgi:hypothetical protein